MPTVRKRVSDLDEAAEITAEDYMLIMTPSRPDAPAAGGTTRRVTVDTVSRFLTTEAVTTLGGLEDVDLTGLASGDVLAYNGTEVKWRPTVIDGGNF